MLNETQIEKLKRFANDGVMTEAVFNVVLHEFIRPRPRAEVTFHELAAERIAINLLNEAWKELLKYKTVEPKVTGSTGNIGL